MIIPQSKEPKLDEVVMSFDPGTLHTGYAVFIGTTLKSYGCIEPARSLSLGQRLLTIQKQVIDLFRVHKPGVVISEDQFMGKNAQTLMSLREVTGAIRIIAAQHNLELILIPSTSVKKIVTGDGRAGKDKVRTSIQDKLDITVTNDNVSDAIAVGYAYLNETGRL